MTTTTRLWLLCLCAGLFAACSGKQPALNQASPTPATTVWFKADSATAGTITGKVRYTGKKSLATKVNMDNAPECALLHDKPVVDEKIAATKDGALANAFVYIKQGLEGKQFEPSAEPAVIDQKGCWFGPRVLGVQVGQTLKVTNSDPLTHNIHPMPEHNRDWNQSQAPNAEPFMRRFTHPEVMIRVKCNIHGWMHAWVGVVAHPYFAVTGADGAFELRNVPPGTYTLEVWQEELGKQEQQITLAATGKSEVVFNLK
jgi:plastocyanin